LSLKLNSPLCKEFSTHSELLTDMKIILSVLLFVI
jgi:hypothetical protein